MALRRCVIALLAMAALPAAAQSITCYALNDDGKYLVGYQGPPWTSPPNPTYQESITGLLPDTIESLYYDLTSGRMYTVDQGNPQSVPDRLGYVTLSSGAFMPIGTQLGPADGASGTVTIGVGGGQTSGLSMNPATGTLWGVTLSGYLYQIDTATGLVRQDAFGPGVDYVRVRTPTGTNIGRVEDIAFRSDGTLLLVVNGIKTAGSQTPAVLYQVNTTNPNAGVATQITIISVPGTPIESEFEGLTFGPGNVLYASTGFGTLNPANRNRFWRIDLATGVATMLYVFPDYAGISDDYESLTCVNSLLVHATLSVSKTNTPASGPDDLPADTVARGSTTQYTIVISNEGPSAADNAVVRDPAPSGLTCSSATCTATSGGASCPGGGGAPQTLSLAALQSAAGIPIPLLPPGSTASITVTCTVP